MNNSTPYPQEFITPEIIDACDDCRVFVDKWFRHMIRKNKDYNQGPGVCPGRPV